MSTFYGFVDAMDWNNGLQSKFYNSIHDCVLDGNEWGDIVEFKNNEHGVPVQVRKYRVNTIEPYELNEFLEESPEMNEDNYLVFSHSGGDMDAMLTIVDLT